MTCGEQGSDREPAGAAILNEKFANNALHPLGLLISALPPTLVAVLAMRVL